LLTPGVALLQPQEAVLEAMLTGWSNQQTSRLGPGLRAALRHAPGAGVSRVEHRRAPQRGRGPTGHRPLSRDELQELFDFCDERVAKVRRSGRKGWLAAYRDAAMFKTMYAWGCVAGKQRGWRRWTGRRMLLRRSS
jgi:hypothetical protein